MSEPSYQLFFGTYAAGTVITETFFTIKNLNIGNMSVSVFL